MRIPLSQHLQTLGNREELLSAKVWEGNEARWITGFLSDGGIVCTKRICNKRKQYQTVIVKLNISDLSIDLTEQEK